MERWTRAMIRYRWWVIAIWTVLFLAGAYATSGLSDLAWALSVILSFSAAMLVMSGSFGLWRAGIFSNAAFAAGVAVVILVLLGGTTWARDGLWAPDGGYATVSGLLFFVWAAVVSGFLAMRMPAAARVPERAAVPA